MNTASWLFPLLGGLLIGTAATLFLWLNGRIAGISNIVGGLWTSGRGDLAWRWFFILGLLVGGVTLAAVHPEAFGESPSSLAQRPRTTSS